MRRVMYAEKSHIPMLKNLWVEAFGDDEGYVLQFLERQLQERFSYIMLEEDEVIAMTHVFPCEIRTPEKSYDFVYLYAVATLKSHQNKGVASELLREIHKDLEKKGFFGTFLFPAEAPLFDYYKKLGYESAGFSGKLDFRYSELFSEPSDENQNADELICEFRILNLLSDIRYIKCEDLTNQQLEEFAHRINDVRSHHYRNFNFEYWNPVNMQFLLHDSALEKRRMMFFKCKGEECFLIWKIQGFDIIISEVAINEEGFKLTYEEMIFAMMKFYGFDFRQNFEHFDICALKFCFTLPYWFEIAQETPRAMMYCFGEKPNFEKFLPGNSI